MNKGGGAAASVLEALQSDLIDAVGLHAELPSEAFGGIRLGAVLGQLALVVVTHGGLRRHTNTQRTHEEQLEAPAAVWSGDL